MKPELLMGTGTAILSQLDEAGVMVGYASGKKKFEARPF